MDRPCSELAEAVARFIRSCDRKYEFPAGGQTRFLTGEESELLERLKLDDVTDGEKIGAMREGRDWSDCYMLVIFGIRLAVMGVRSAREDTFRLGILALAAGCLQLDWRDALGAFAVFEDCGGRVGVDFRHEVENVASSNKDDELKSKIDSFFSREDRWRAVDKLAIAQSGDGDDFTYINNPGY